MKKCTLCNLEKEFDLFYKKRGISYTSRCKECIKKESAKYVANNIVKTRNSSRDYYYRVTKTKDSSKLYREKCFKDGLKGFLQTICKACLKRKGGDITWEYLYHLWETQNGLCDITGYNMTFISGNGKIYTNVSVDRINGEGIYTKDNVRLTCVGANIARGIMKEDEFIKMCKDIINYANKKQNS